MVELNEKEWNNLYKSSPNSVLIDVRTLDEYNSMCIEDSTNIDIQTPNEFLEKVNKIDKNKKIFVYCHSGARSYNACKILEQFGFKNVYNLIGGISEWSGKVISKDGSYI
tara:strand:- start:1017 stop:1346 length:330 start_codon:yes stop_codon:yes gene_type:complete